MGPGEDLKPMVMICGGLDKHLDYSPLRSLVGKKVKHMIAIGQAREIMRSTFGDVVAVDTFTSLEEAVKAARGLPDQVNVSYFRRCAPALICLKIMSTGTML